MSHFCIYIFTLFKNVTFGALVTNVQEKNSQKVIYIFYYILISALTHDDDLRVINLFKN